MTPHSAADQSWTACESGGYDGTGFDWVIWGIYY